MENIFKTTGQDQHSMNDPVPAESPKVGSPKNLLTSEESFPKKTKGEFQHNQYSMNDPFPAEPPKFGSPKTFQTSEESSLIPITLRTTINRKLL